MRGLLTSGTDFVELVSLAMLCPSLASLSPFLGTSLVAQLYGLDLSIFGDF